jgi:hypothetical protein
VSVPGAFDGALTRKCADAHEQLDRIRGVLCLVIIGLMAFANFMLERERKRREARLTLGAGGRL